MNNNTRTISEILKELKQIHAQEVSLKEELKELFKSGHEQVELRFK